jgi:hypothetical protein
MKAFMGRLMCSWACRGFPPFIIGGDRDDVDDDADVVPEDDEKK